MTSAYESVVYDEIRPFFTSARRGDAFHFTKEQLPRRWNSDPLHSYVATDRCEVFETRIPVQQVVTSMFVSPSPVFPGGEQEYILVSVRMQLTPLLSRNDIPSCDMRSDNPIFDVMRVAVEGADKNAHLTAHLLAVEMVQERVLEGLL